MDRGRSRRDWLGRRTVAVLGPMDRRGSGHIAAAAVAGHTAVVDRIAVAGHTDLGRIVAAAGCGCSLPAEGDIPAAAADSPDYSLVLVEPARSLVGRAVAVRTRLAGRSFADRTGLVGCIGRMGPT